MSASSRAQSTAPSAPRRPGSEPSKIGDQAPGAAGAAHGAGDALDHSVQPRTQREDDGRTPRRRADPGVEGRRRDDKEEGRHTPDGGSEPRFRALPVVNA